MLREKVRRALCGAALLGLLGAAPAALVVPAEGGAGWTPAALAQLQADLDGQFARASALRGAHAGFVALETATGAVLYERNADDEFQPASTLKLLVGSVALDRLGPQYRFRTQLGVRGAQLLLVGGGDPLLTAADLDAAASAVAAAGVIRAPWDLAADDGRYEGRALPGGLDLGRFRVRLRGAGVGPDRRRERRARRLQCRRRAGRAGLERGARRRYAARVPR